MILCYLPNGASDFAVQAKEVAHEHWPHHPLAFRNVGRIDMADLEVKEVEGVLVPAGCTEIAIAYRNRNIPVLDVPPRTQIARPPYRRDLDKSPIPTVVFTDRIYPDLLQTLCALPEAKLSALAGCLHSLTYLQALLSAEMERGERREGVIESLVRRIAQLRGVMK